MAFKAGNKIKISVGIIAFNEEKLIEKSINSIIKQKYNKDKINISEIIIVSSGSSDRTDAIVEFLAKKNKKNNIILLKQTKREGKASAVNLFLQNAANDVLVVTGGDLVLKQNVIEKLIMPFKDPEVGICGAHPIPVNRNDNFIGFTVNILWLLHHQISLISPKMGETIAFRRVFKRIPVFSAVDEVNIEALVRGQGYKEVYVPKAIVINKGAETIQDFLKQRRRIYAGHLASKKEYSYQVSTMRISQILPAFFKILKLDIKFIIFLCGSILLEILGRSLGYYDFYFKKKENHIWSVSASTKEF